jgi:AmpD protein
MTAATSGWLPGVRRVPSPNCDSRPPGTVVDLAILHCISLPRGRYRGDAVERLFTNRLDVAADPSFAGLAGLRVSAHFLLRRDGRLLQFVPLQARAWHAGVSRWRARERCNDHSIGIELEGVDDGAFDDRQYAALAPLLAALRARLPLRQLAGHSDVAPGRKSDPGARFDWPRLYAALAKA